MIKKYFFLIILGFFLCNSCVKDIDFEQTKNVELTPTLTVALINGKIEETSIINSSGVEETEFKDVSILDVFSSSEFQKVKKIIVDFEFINSFDRRFTLLFTFLDDRSFVTYQLPLITVPENAVGYKFSHEIIIENSPLILDSKNLEFTVRLLPSSDGSMIDMDEKNVFKFVSSGTFHLKID